jgi:predicted transglutaminase-like protease
MDQEILVDEAKQLTLALDNTKIEPKLVMITISSETGNWKIWIVPKDDKIDKHEFYRITAEAISDGGLKNIDVGSVELRKSSNPEIIGLTKMIRVEGISTVNISSNTMNGILLPDGIIIRAVIRN